MDIEENKNDDISNKLYILELSYGKYYVGKSKHVNDRILKHFESHGTAWTKKYKPIKIIKIIDRIDEFDEDKYTKVYMNIYGIDNVRGGSYTGIRLDPDEYNFIQKELCTANDVCFKCHKSGHFAKHCRSDVEKRKIVTCYKCGKKGHYANRCKVKK